MSDNAVLLMAHGSIDSIDDVEEFYTRIRKGKKPSDELIKELKERYVKIGGKSPLLEITKKQASGLKQLLGDREVYIGMKYWRPYVKDTISLMKEDGVKSAIALALAPHYSSMSIGGYIKAVEEAQVVTGSDINFSFVKSWWSNEEFIKFIASSIEKGFEKFPDNLRDNVHVIFTAHSLPERILESDDPYPSEVSGSAGKIAGKMNLKNWSVAYQSAGQTGDKWLGPGLPGSIRELAGRGVKATLICPAGFVSDHLEILYDIDIEAKSLADSVGIRLERTDLPNDQNQFITVLASVIL